MNMQIGVLLHLFSNNEVGNFKTDKTQPTHNTAEC